MTTYAVTGASGQLGRLAVQELLSRGLDVREADYSRPETLSPALAGVERLLLVSSSVAGQRVAHHSNVIQAAQIAQYLDAGEILGAAGTGRISAASRQDYAAAAATALLDHEPHCHPPLPRS